MHKKLWGIFAVGLVIIGVIFICMKNKVPELVDMETGESVTIDKNNMETVETESSEARRTAAEKNDEEMERDSEYPSNDLSGDTTTSESHEVDPLDSSGESLRETTTVTTETIKEMHNESVFTVTFKDYDGTVLKVDEVGRGENAVAPQVPSREGYRFIKWDTAFNDVKVNIVVTAVYEEITEPSLMTENAMAKAGDTVKIAVSVLKNPGLLGMAVNITYDESVMILTKVENGSVMSEYTFTPPKNLKSGCNAAWNINDLPSVIQDGEVLLLYFDIIHTAADGFYPVSVSCNQDAFDDKYHVVNFSTINGSITVK